MKGSVTEDIGAMVIASVILMVLAFAVTLGVGLALKLLHLVG